MNNRIVSPKAILTTVLASMVVSGLLNTEKASALKRRIDQRMNHLSIQEINDLDLETVIELIKE